VEFHTGTRSISTAAAVLPATTSPVRGAGTEPALWELRQLLPTECVSNERLAGIKFAFNDTFTDLYRSRRHGSRLDL